MKKLFFTAFLCLSALTALAQEKDVTKFLGIPVDGSKAEMIRKLKEKGYYATPGSEILEGEFNGTDVHIHVATNNNKVYRLMVADANASDVRSIQIRFNKLCHQFKNNPRYESYDNYEIPDNEDISREMTVHHKRYEAVFYQKPIIPDSLVIQTLYTDDELKNATKEQLMELTAYLVDRKLKKSVWFMISRMLGKYHICMYYDNEYNRANGEDL